MPKNGKRVSHFLAVLNNYTEEDYKHYTTWPSHLFSYFIVAKEVGGENGTPHLQCYYQLKKQTAFSTIKKHFPACHMKTDVAEGKDQLKGTPKENIDYIKNNAEKPNPDFVEFGVVRRMGKRTDLHDVVEAIEAKADTYTLLTDHASVYSRCPRWVERTRFEAYKKCYRNVFIKMEVIVLYGRAGAGKSRLARELCGDQPYHVITQEAVRSDGSVWFDGYDYEPILIIDDFMGWIKYRNFLTMLDGYPCPRQVKGSFTLQVYNKVIITSNKHPRLWYKQKGFTKTLSRRLTDIRHIVKVDEGAESSITSAPLSG